jgi:hypothetical protein
LLFVLVSAPAHSETQGPPLTASPASLRASLHCPAAFTHTAHEPVLLVHGTGAYAAEEWGWSYVPALAKLGYDVCTVDLPNYALDDIQISTEYVVYAVRFMAAESGRKVDMLGASQGGLEPRWAVKWWPDVQADTDDIVMLVTPNHGTIAASPGTIGPSRCFPSCWQMRKGSSFLNALNAGDETPGEVSYTSIYSQFDELVQPNSTSMLNGAVNILEQSLCPGRPVDHLGMSTGDAVAFALAVDAFGHSGPADPARFDKANCTKASMDGAQPFKASFDGRYLTNPPQPHWSTAEPPLKLYAR